MAEEAAEKAAAEAAAEGHVTRIGIIPPKSKDKAAEITKSLESNRDVIEKPEGEDTKKPVLFTFIDYYNLMLKAVQGEAYDIVIAYSLEDEYNSTINNVCVAAYNIRKILGMKTIFIVSFSEIETKINDKDPDRPHFETRKSYIDNLLNQEQYGIPAGLKGVVVTTSSEGRFLLNTARDIRDATDAYLESMPKRVESQRDYVRYIPDFTLIGINEPQHGGIKKPQHTGIIKPKDYKKA